MASYFPPITDEQIAPLRALQSLLTKSPELLSQDDCPYSPSTREFLRDIFKTADQQPEVDLNDPDIMDQQLSQLYGNLIGFQNQMKGQDAKDKVQWAKAIVSILERVLVLQERNMNLKKFGEFQRKVVAFLDDVLDPAQRTEFIEALGQFIEAPKD